MEVEIIVKDKGAVREQSVLPIEVFLQMVSDHKRCEKGREKSRAKNAIVRAQKLEERKESIIEKLRL